LTRLTARDIQHIPRTMKKYDEELKEKIGCRLIEIAEDAARTDTRIEAILRKRKAAAVRMTAGKGVIEGFSEAVASILNHLGMRAFITEGSEIVGMAEAFEQGADLIFAADDEQFVAINLTTRHVVDNAAATARAYVAVLDKMAKGLEGKSVLVIGLGKVGTEAVSELIARRARPLLVDVDRRKLIGLRTKYKDEVTIFHTIAEPMRLTNLVIDAAPAKNILKSSMVNENTLISAPAIPIGLTRAALRRIRSRHLVHDPLQLGVATMAVEACVE